MNIETLYSHFKNSSGISTDSRNVPENALFFALKGPSFDGNKFAASALQKGALKVIVDNPEYQISDACILVDDVLKTLQNLASFHRKQFRIPVIGITGTNGKTTTKELIYAVLSTRFKTHYTKGNFNNHIGVPLTLLTMGGGCRNGCN